jgi:hypothetical protein
MVYTQHRQGLNIMQDDCCPRVAFLEDLVSMIQVCKEATDHIALLIDGNSDIKNSDLTTSLMACSLQEVLLECHGPNAPATYRRNSSCTPIDGI